MIKELFKVFFNGLHEKVSELKKTKQIKCGHELVQTAYDELKKIKLAQPTTQNSSVYTP